MLTHFIGVAAAMDLDFWASSRVHSSKHFSSHRSSEVDDDARTYFTCPFCYMDTELPLLCNHLEEEHCFDVKNAVCPVCALNLAEDIVGHFKVHHASSIKRRPQKSGFWSFHPGRSSLGGLSSKCGSEDVNGSAPDPLLFQFLCSTPYSASSGEQSQDLCSSSEVSFNLETESSKPSMSSHSEEKEDSEESRQRAAFCQQLILSTIF